MRILHTACRYGPTRERLRFDGSAKQPIETKDTSPCHHFPLQPSTHSGAKSRLLCPPSTIITRSGATGLESPVGSSSTSSSLAYLGGAYTKHADDRVSATTLRTRRDEWIAHDVFFRLEQIVLEALDQVIGLDLTHLSVDGCCVKASCDGDDTGPSPTDQGKSEQKRSVLVVGHGLPIGVALAGANLHDSPLLRPTLVMDSTSVGQQARQAIRLEMTAYPRNL